ncbi:MAG: hypothetical protein SPF19_03480 [Oliverpabstia sp.]|nr:hypothetical protein [Lachnospiraceae bacterium]MDY5025582.1 hypothetical protein [Oliverpabstia sp.]
MTDKELQRLKRGELLEMLLEQSKENDRLKEEVEELRAQLADRKIEIESAGTIAEASFKLNGVFDAAQAAAQQYLDNLQLLYDREEVNCVKKEEETEAYVKKLLEDTQRECEIKEQQMQDRCTAMKQTVKERCDSMKENMIIKCNEMEEETRRKCEEMEESTRIRCEEREKESLEKCQSLDKKAEEDVEKRWDDLSSRLEAFYQAHEGLRELLTASGEIQRD